jgi:hypothetical protein
MELKDLNQKSEKDGIINTIPLEIVIQETSSNDPNKAIRAATKIIMADGTPGSFYEDFSSDTTVAQIKSVFARCFDKALVRMQINTRLKWTAVVSSFSSVNIPMKEVLKSLKEHGKKLLAKKGYQRVVFSEVTISHLFTSKTLSQEDYDKPLSNWASERERLYLAVAVLNKNGKKIWW